MIRTIVFALCLLPLCLVGVSADQKAHQFTGTELDDADGTLAGIPDTELMLINNLRYLLRPAYEAPLMSGRAFRPCPLPPFEEPGDGPLTQMEALRLWAVLQSGLPVDMSLHVGRLLETPTPKDGESLTNYGVLMAACLQVHRADLATPEALLKTTERILSAAMKERSATAMDSPLIAGQTVDPRWYANHLWRAVICRCAIELGLKFNVRVWETDLSNLGGVMRGVRGWDSPGFPSHVGYDLHANLIAMGAISLALTAPADTLSKSTVRSLERRIDDVPAVLARLQREFPDQVFDGGRFALANSFLPEFAPTGTTGDAWQSAILRRAVAAQDASGVVFVRNRLAGDLGLGSPGTHFGRQPADTALSCLALSGGFFSNLEAPLAKHDLPKVGRVMYALSVKHASALPIGVKPINEVDELASLAIDDACDWLEKHQDADGSWTPLTGEMAGPINARFSVQKSISMTALAMLALLHGGRERDSNSIRAGMRWILKHSNTAINNGRVNQTAEMALTTYDAALILMMLESYYAPEQREAGVLDANGRENVNASRKAMLGKLEREHQKLVEALVSFIYDARNTEDNGGWYMRPLPGHASTPRTYNQITLFALLGYRAAGRLGAVLDPRLFTNEARRVMRQYFGDGSMKNVELERAETRTDRKGNPVESIWKGSIQPGGWTEWCGAVSGKNAQRTLSLQYSGSCIGILALARDELRARDELDLDVARDIDLHIHGAQAWMSANYYDKIGFTGLNSLVVPCNAYDDLRMVSRGLVLAGLDVLSGGLDWYDVTARGLIDAQWSEGPWPGG